MPTLELNRELLEVYSAFFSSGNKPWKIRLRHQIIVLIMFGCLLFGWSSSVVFIIMYQKADMRNALYAVFQVAGEFSANFTVLVACIYPKSVENIFIKLNDVRENGKFCVVRLKWIHSSKIHFNVFKYFSLFVSKCSSN